MDRSEIIDSINAEEINSYFSELNQINFKLLNNQFVFKNVYSDGKNSKSIIISPSPLLDQKNGIVFGAGLIKIAKWTKQDDGSYFGNVILNFPTNVVDPVITVSISGASSTSSNINVYKFQYYVRSVSDGKIEIDVICDKNPTNIYVNVQGVSISRYSG